MNEKLIHVDVLVVVEAAVATRAHSAAAATTAHSYTSKNCTKHVSSIKVG